AAEAPDIAGLGSKPQGSRRTFRYRAHAEIFHKAAGAAESIELAVLVIIGARTVAKPHAPLAVLHQRVGHVIPQSLQRERPRDLVIQATHLVVGAAKDAALERADPDAVRGVGTNRDAFNQRVRVGRQRNRHESFPLLARQTAGGGAHPDGALRVLAD